MRRNSYAGLVLAAAACRAFAQDDTAEKAAFQKVCGACHASTMVSDLKTEEEWSETIDAMTTLGAKGTEQEFALVSRYLAHNLTKVNVNTAAAAQIAPVLGVSDAIAQAVIDYRTQHGAFSTLEDLKKVPGVPAARIEERKTRIAFR